MRIPDSLLGGISPDTFLREYWQKKSLLIRQALPGFQSPISADELAGLSLEAEVESRLVIEKGFDAPWKVLHGPQQEAIYQQLPDSHWTLLVQEVNRHVPQVAELFDLFAFIPTWRLDDIMVSYAEDQGSVGPHVDNYDVFLLQVEGNRHWQIGQAKPVRETDLVADIEMRILREFEAEDAWLLEPGDMLYLPPGVPHHGVAQGECMTYSIGFRAPTLHQMWSHYVESLIQTTADQFYADPDLTLTERPGEISASAMDRVREMVRTLPLDDASIDNWFGQFITDPVRGLGPEPVEPPLSEQAFLALLRENAMLTRSEDTRFAYRQTADGPRLYINGHAIVVDGVDAELVRLIADQRRFTLAELSPYLEGEERAFLTGLYNQGWLEE